MGSHCAADRTRHMRNAFIIVMTKGLSGDKQRKSFRATEPFEEGLSEEGRERVFVALD